MESVRPPTSVNSHVEAEPSDIGNASLLFDLRVATGHCRVTLQHCRLCLFYLHSQIVTCGFRVSHGIPLAKLSIGLVPYRLYVGCDVVML